MTTTPTHGKLTQMASAALAAPRAKSKRTGQRPRLLRLTPALRNNILDMILQGVPLTTSAISNGIPKRTFFEWLEKGRCEDAREPYRAFALEVEAAQETWAARTVCSINAAASKDWRAGMTLLERQRPSEWGDPNRGAGTVVNLNVAAERSESVGEVLGAAKRVLTSEDFLRLVDELAGPDIVDATVVEVGELVAA